jgi:hypothetical protein
MREQQLNELTGASRLAREFFNKLIRRIECTKPLAGSGITISEKENGFQVSFENYTTVTLNVCSNGTPAELVVFARPQN